MSGRVFRCLATAAALILFAPAAFAQQILSEKQFTTAFAKAMQRWAPHTTVTLRGSDKVVVRRKSRQPAVVPMRDLYEGYKSRPSAKDALFEAMGLEVFEFLQRGSKSRTSNLVPLIRGRAWIEKVRKRKPDIAFEPLNSDLYLVYSRREKEQGRVISVKEFQALKLPLDIVRRRAINNFRHTWKNIIQSKRAPIRRMFVHRTINSSLALNDNFWLDMAATMKGSPVIAMPTESILWVSDSANRTAIKNLRLQTAILYKSSSTRLSDKLFVRRNNKWVYLDPVKSAKRPLMPISKLPESAGAAPRRRKGDPRLAPGAATTAAAIAPTKRANASQQMKAGQSHEKRKQRQAAIADKMLAQILPLVLGRKAIQEMQRRMALNKRKPAVEFINRELFLVYGRRVGDKIEFLTKKGFAALRTPPLRARKRAVENFKDAFPSVRIERTGQPIRRMRNSNSFDSSLIFRNDVWDRIQSETKSQVVIAIPAVDVVLFTTSLENKHLEMLREEAKKIAETQEYPVSDRIFAWRGGRWILLP